MPEILKVKIKRIHSFDLPLPQYMSEQASGMDIYAAQKEECSLEPGNIALIPTGFALELPLGYEAQIRPRSGLALRHGISLPNAPATIDADYRGEIKIILINLGHNNFTIKYGDRIGQLVIMPLPRIQWQIEPNLNTTKRSGGGFGHTG
ncbi:MAG: dUTP pyrophosphatase [Candidatus Magnetoglobus multicellularis str. Araruama]|uniref:Deoxyuridine 5'-triphosphate nucleotidohydrolase n=1 Tax=Candidatus Magnetoglobus multicellularis str. Araruama TaxID=890399 RepID=A0A1V1P0E3_9BACT|nr:MAG: dUTP pyrophosphatase [Candidatus Magnetoglobus multicellularis str. Araruama]